MALHQRGSPIGRVCLDRWYRPWRPHPASELHASLADQGRQPAFGDTRRDAFRRRGASIWSVFTSPGPRHVSEATEVVLRLLRAEVGRDWSARAGGLDWSCRETTAHIAHDLAKYAAQLAGRAEESYLNFRLVIPDDAPQAEVLRVLDASGRLLAQSVSDAPADARAWHYGPTDATGFAAMGIGELLVHAYDIARGLGIDWRPPEELSRVVVARLFDPSNGADPSSLLLWATGRTELPGRPPVDHWVWRAAVS